MLKKIPKDIYVAVSGGVDSMSILNFLSRNHSVSVLHFNHKTEHGFLAQNFLEQFCKDNNTKIIIGHLNNNKPKKESPEEFWRKERYKFFDQYQDKPIITAHHLDDVLEWWLFSTIHGGIPKLIKYNNRNIIRPFLITEKKDLLEWSIRKEVPFETDQSNFDLRYKRNAIRS